MISAKTFELKMGEALLQSTSSFCPGEKARKLLTLAIQTSISRYNKDIRKVDFVRIYSEVQLPEDQDTETSNQSGKSYKMKKLTRGFKKKGNKTQLASSTDLIAAKKHALLSAQRSNGINRDQCLRIVGRLDIKGPNVVKGIKMEGLRVIGAPTKVAKTYYDQGADEILYIDLVASLYERNGATSFLEQCVQEGVHIPICVGGGIRTLDDISLCLRAGADKVAINTAAIKNPTFITEASKRFGCQCIVGSIECIRTETVLGDLNKGALWEPYYDCGRERSYKDAIAWAKELQTLGCGELLVTSIDRDGTRTGLDIELCKSIVTSVTIPVICSGGIGSSEDILDLEAGCIASGVASASLFLYTDETAMSVKQRLNDTGVFVRNNFVPKTIPSNKSKKDCVLVIDYGLGNLYSIVRAVESLGYETKIITTGDQLVGSSIAILPGVGAFPDGMQGLVSRGFDIALKKYIEGNGKLLSICLGAQMLLSVGNEFAKTNGLDIVTGSVDKLEGPKMKIPNVGWNQIQFSQSGKETLNSIFDGIEHNSQLYFNHSYYFNVGSLSNKNVLAVCNYSNFRFCAAFSNSHGNVFGVQFHPEKSGAVGMRILQNYLLL